MYFPRYKHLLTWHAASGSVHRTGILAAVEEIEGRSDHGAQQDVDVAPSPLGYRVLNVVLEKTNKQDFSSLLFCWRSNMHRHHRSQGTVPRPWRVVSTHLRVIWSRERSRKGLQWQYGSFACLLSKLRYLIYCQIAVFTLGYKCSNPTDSDRSSRNSIFSLTFTGNT